MEFVSLFIQLFARAAIFVIFLHVLLSMFMAPDKPLRIGIARIAEPILEPFRRFIKPINGIDFSPVVAMIAINLVEYLLNLLLSTLFK